MKTYHETFNAFADLLAWSGWVVGFAGIACVISCTYARYMEHYVGNLVEATDRAIALIGALI